MKITMGACSILLATSLLTAGQYGSIGGAEENRILSLEGARAQAQQHKDTKTLDDLLASTMVYTDDDGTLMSKSEFLARVADTSHRIDQLVNEAMTVHTYGNSAVVTGAYREKGTANRKSYQHRGRFTDMWVSQDGVWQCVASQSTLVNH